MSKILVTPSYKEVKPVNEYVYIHYRLDDGLPFYVGKGVYGRGYSTVGRNNHWKYTARKHGVKVDIIKDGLTTEQAYSLEIETISRLRSDGYNLTNMTDGGEGRSGFESEKRKTVYCSNGMKFTHAEEAAKWLRESGNKKATSKIVSACALGRKRSIYGYGFSHDPNPPTPVITGKEAKALAAGMNGIPVYSSDGNSYMSASDAKFILTGTEGSGGHILEACRGDRLTAYGLTWSLNPNGPFPEYVAPYERTNRKKWKRVKCENGMEFDALFLALKWLSDVNGKKYSHSAMQQALKRGARCGGFFWYRIDEKKKSCDTQL